ncbi:D-cysteine desulfhydrase, partial [Morganella morganii]|nr:D-cysteine desulfhydrase [Morganella morganii]
LNKLSRLLGQEIYIKREERTPLAAGGNKLRKKEFRMADGLEKGEEFMITAGAIQPKRGSRTAGDAEKNGLKCMALLENPIGSQEANFLNKGNKLLTYLLG